jgi:two-component system response regulator GlrR
MNSAPEETKVQAFGQPVPRPHTHPTLKWADANGSYSAVLHERTVVGSAPNASLVIRDGAVSRIHAELEPREDGAWVRDLGSRNGTFVEGILVSSARIPDGGKVRFGSTEVSVDYSPAEDSDDQVDLWPEPHFGRLLGVSRPMRRLFAYLARIASNDSPVLIEGETGTGKELIAHAIHEASPRKSKPLVIVDCAALPEHLIESELFGHARGAFTGALRSRVGAIEAADGGTVFLDEIGELPLTLQPHLLRVLESGTIRLVGETTRKNVDVRFISATHRDVRTMVNIGAFREDLYFRLAVLPVTVPPLRERKEDLQPLVQAFLPPGVLASPELLRELLKRPWLGNVRELRNFVHRASAIGTQKALALESSLPSEGVIAVAPPEGTTNTLLGALSFDVDFRTFREQLTNLGEREYIKRLLAKHGRNVSAAAREAGLDRTYVHRLIRNHSL